MSEERLRQIRSGGDVPRHVAVLMDGSERWARRRGLPRHVGHDQGLAAVGRAVTAATEAGVEVLTLLAFSPGSWDRPAGEVARLMKLIRRYAVEEEDSLREQGVEVRVVGDLARLDASTRDAVVALASGTRGGRALRLNLMISSGGREELLHAARVLVERVRQGDLAPGDIDGDLLEDALPTRGLPDPDLLIRTAGELRVDDFMVWQLAYTELYVTPVLWPDFGRDEMFEALLDYQGRERRFGRVHAS